MAKNQNIVKGQFWKGDNWKMISLKRNDLDNYTSKKGTVSKDRKRTDSEMDNSEKRDKPKKQQVFKGATEQINI